jgi:hypothetical protein
MASFHDQEGRIQQVNLAVTAYAQAAEAGSSLPQFLASQYSTDETRYGSVFSQLLASEGIFMRSDASAGIRASTMDQILNGTMKAGVNTQDGIPTSRLLYPAVMMQAVEERLQAALNATPDAFEKMIAVDEGINGDRYEQPLINYDRPSQARSRGTSQLALPASMMVITTSDKAYRVPSFGIGLEISDQALKSTTLDLVAMSVARQAMIERNERAQGYMLALLNGDVDNNDGSLASLGLVDNSSTFDAAATGGAMTQKAWMKFLTKNGTKRKLTHLVTDLDTAMKIENRAGKPTIMSDNPNSPRINTEFTLMNPTWATNPSIFLVEDPAWPAGTVMGLDKSWAVRRVRNLSASYQAVESYVMRRSSSLRIDWAEHVNRLYPEAFAGLVLV